MEKLARGVVAESAEAAAREAEAVFADELERQTAEADAAPREKRLPRDAGRAGRALEAVMREAQRIAALALPATEEADDGSGRAGDAPRSGIGLEVPVESEDGWLKGRVDRVEKAVARVLIVDYKSGLRAGRSEPYERQLQLYAVMWRDTYGSWPTEAYVVYPLLGVSHAIDIGEAAAEATASEARQVVQRVVESRSPESLANPGPACRYCEFRPWCEPFWRYQAGGWMEAETSQRAWLGIEAVVSEVSISWDMVRMRLSWGTKVVSAQADSRLMPHATEIAVGKRVRLLEWSIRGQRHAPTLISSPTSELFVVDAHS